MSRPNAQGKKGGGLVRANGGNFGLLDPDTAAHHSLILQEDIFAPLRPFAPSSPSLPVFVSVGDRKERCCLRLDGAAMSLSSYFHALYSLDTLDKRFAASSKAPDSSRKVDDDPSNGPRQNGRARKTEVSNDISPPQWKTPEFYFYYLVFLVCVPLMFKAGLEASLCECTVAVIQAAS